MVTTVLDHKITIGRLREKKKKVKHTSTHFLYVCVHMQIRTWISKKLAHTHTRITMRECLVNF
jgi:hypothetical protein